MITTDKKARHALIATFPSFQAWQSFSQNRDNGPIKDSVLNFAFRHALIKDTDIKSLDACIVSNSLGVTDLNEAQEIAFEDFLDRKDELLRVNLSLRGLTARINSFLDQHKIQLPKVTNSMLTRLKKEPADTEYKRNVLRSLAFWLGYERGDLIARWNYETLFKMCSGKKTAANVQGGVRIGLALYSRGDVIDHDLLGWLKKMVKNYIEQSISHLSYGKWGKVRSHDITTIYIDFPKEAQSDDPGAYRRCLHGAVSLAHQIAIKWALSRYSTKNRFLSIGIVAGEFQVLDKYLLPLLSAKLPNDPIIRVSEYARQCLLINDIRVLMCLVPTETTLFNGEVLLLWWIESFWSTLYLDFVSELLEDTVLLNNRASRDRLSRLLWKLPGDCPQTEGNAANAVSIFLKSPNNSMLGVEIAKTLYFRRRFDEALEILQVTLSLNPKNLIARTLRMTLLTNAGIDAADHEAAQCLFRQAKKEAVFIETNCDCEAEDFYCEYAILSIAQALCAVRHCRQEPKPLAPQALDALKSKTFSLLGDAEDYFEKAITVSPSGVRAAYLLCSVRLLRAMFFEDDEHFINSEKPFTLTDERRIQISRNTMGQIGFRHGNLMNEEQNEYIENLLMSKITCHDDAIALYSYRPTIFYCYAVSLWELMVIRTPDVIAKAIQALRRARAIAETAHSNNMCIYSVTRVYSEMIPAQHFISHIDNCIRFLEIQMKCGEKSCNEKNTRSMMMLNSLSPFDFTPDTSTGPLLSG
ncbi:MAG: hypothetical protein ACP5IL_12010 [Syntrophobacteraceae bacterium]